MTDEIKKPLDRRLFEAAQNWYGLRGPQEVMEVVVGVVGKLLSEAEESALLLGMFETLGRCAFDAVNAGAETERDIVAAVLSTDHNKLGLSRHTLEQMTGEIARKLVRDAEQEGLTVGELVREMTDDDDGIG